MRSIMRHTALAAALATTLALGACAGANEGFPGGMRSEQLQENRWTINPGRLDVDEANLQIRAYYRAAVLAKAAGYEYFQVVDYDEGPLGIGAGTSFQVVGVHDAKAPLTCLAEAQFQHMCVVRSVEEAFTQYGPQLGKTRAQFDEEVRIQQVPVGGKKD